MPLSGKRKIRTGKILTSPTAGDLGHVEYVWAFPVFIFRHLEQCFSFLHEYPLDIAEIKEMSCVVDWYVSMDKSWGKTDSRAAYWRRKADLRLDTHSSSLCLQEQLAKTRLLGEAQGIECFNKWHYQTLRLLIQPGPQVKQNWGSAHKQRHFLDLWKERKMMPLLSLGCPSTLSLLPHAHEVHLRRWRFLSVLSIQTHNYLFQHL